MNEEIRKEFKRGSKVWNSLPLWLKDPYRQVSEDTQTIISVPLRLTSSEYKRFMEMRRLQELSASGLLKQALRVYDLYLNGRLAPVLDDMKIGGCGE